MSTHTPNSQRRRATPRQIARAVHRGIAPVNVRPRPPLPDVSAPSEALPSLSPEQLDPPLLDEQTEAAGQEEGPRWGAALFLSQEAADASGAHAGWMGRIRERFPRGSPYSWKERDWRANGWSYRLRLIPAVAAVLIALLIISTFAFVIASRAANTARTQIQVSTIGQSAPASSHGVILQQPAPGQPTPVAPQYTVGVWVTNYSPSSGGTEQVYVRVSQSNAGPMAGVRVFLSVSWDNAASRYGPATTNAYGLAAFTVVVNAPPGQPEYVTATTTIRGTSASADTIFVPA